MITPTESSQGWTDSINLSGLKNSEAGRFLSEYARIPGPKLEDHVKDIAHRGWTIKSYPCFQKLTFLHFDLMQSPIYDTIIAQTQAGGIFLDLGCGLGQDIRRLVYDHAPADRLIGMDIIPEYVQLGYQLFHDDETRLKSQFLVQDFFVDTHELDGIKQRIMVMNSGYFLHLWNWDKQLQAAKRMIQLMAPKTRAVITGVHFGRDEVSGLWEGVPADLEEMFLHNPETLKRLWEEAALATGSKWRLWCRAEDDEYCKSLDSRGCRLRWIVERE
ncbi:hypothetical protein BDV29DRAFT_160409 [Aspergillus leporis]|uniref:Uncharacterized protein n=1 Tax=Aspergillus leporis TaxID=41062 RepID=A0A5N5WTN8_9EURO|nr:hypothetical protein BDV29DRAFT_160409 [Aspergillus leporis]